jgi:hypothetical protein
MEIELIVKVLELIGGIVTGIIPNKQETIR